MLGRLSAVEEPRVARRPQRERLLVARERRLPARRPEEQQLHLVEVERAARARLAQVRPPLRLEQRRRERRRDRHQQRRQLLRQRGRGPSRRRAEAEAMRQQPGRHFFDGNVG
eukprot:1810261-Prymnesium_polylepis.1